MFVVTGIAYLLGINDLNMNRNSRIYVAGHRGLVGSALLRRLTGNGNQRAEYDCVITRTHAELDLTDASAVNRFFATEAPEYVFLAAAKVGGILANDNYPADFITTNLLIQTNVLMAARHHRAKRLLFLGSSCIYPRDCPQPIKEEYLLTGRLEATNRPYAIAKIAGIEACWAFNRQYGTEFLSAMPTNLYGVGDNYDMENSHVIPALIRKMQDARRSGAKSVTVWGSGEPRREFLFSDDLADACVFLMNLPDETYRPLLASDRNDGVPPIVNIGSGADLTIRELAETIAEVVGFGGGLVFDRSKPDGTARKLLNVDRLSALGWKCRTRLVDGLRVVVDTIQRTSEKF